MARYRNKEKERERELFNYLSMPGDVPEKSCGVQDYKRRLIGLLDRFLTFPCLTTQKYLD